MPTKVLKRLLVDIEEPILDEFLARKIRDARTDQVKECTCLIPTARCHVSKRPLFLKRCIKIKVRYVERTEFVVDETLYFSPKQYTWFLLQGK